jgi:membrane protease YdiL (CAAX protease family)
VENTTSNEQLKRNRNLLILLMVIVLAAAALFWVCIQAFHLQGLPLYFTQLGLYLVFIGLALWGLRWEHIPLRMNLRLAGQALLITLIAWGVFALFIQLTGLASLNEEFSALQNMPAWKIALQILSTWFFVGMGEELLFRGYFLNAFHAHFASGSGRRRWIHAVLLCSVFFSLWHLPARMAELLTGGLDWATLLLSLAVLFLLGAAFSFLYLRSGNLLLVGLVHGVMDYPLIGKDTQLSFIILLTAIACVEIWRWAAKKRSIASAE